jgi:hypothetical protein
VLNWLGVEFHQRQYFLRHTHLDRKPQRAGFTCGERIIMCPMAARKLIGKDFRGRGLHPFGQQLYRPSLNLRESLLPHVGENQREVEGIFNRLRVTGFDNARSRESSNLRIDRTEHRELA